MLVDSKNGRVTLNDRAKKLFEATEGPYAEFTFRMIRAETEPYHMARYEATLHDLGRQKGLVGDSLRAFLRVPDAASRAIAMHEADVSTFQQSGRALEWIEKGRQAMRDHPVFDWIDALGIHTRRPWWADSCRESRNPSAPCARRTSRICTPRAMP